MILGETLPGISINLLALCQHFLFLLLSSNLVVPLFYLILLRSELIVEAMLHPPFESVNEIEKLIHFSIISFEQLLSLSVDLVGLLIVQQLEFAVLCKFLEGPCISCSDLMG